MKCIDCKHPDSQVSLNMARHGFAGCGARPVTGRYQSMTHERDCADFAAAPVEEVKKRITWLSNQFKPQRTKA